MSIQVHWHEGLFLQPHHLQLIQHGFNERVECERRLSWPYSYGVIEGELLYDELQDMRVRFKRLRAIMPSGLEVDYPNGAEIPSLDIKQMFAKGNKSFDIFLGVPLWLRNRPNSFRQDQEPDPRVKLLYRLKEESFADENTGENPKEIQLRRINARLMFDYEDRSDMEVLPLLRIKRGVGDEEGRPRLDPEFAYPSMLFTASPVLRDMVRALVSQVDATRDEVDRQLHNGGMGVEQKFEHMFRLYMLSRFSGRMLPLMEALNVPLYNIYLELRMFLAELATLRPGQAVFVASSYNHDDPYPCFKELDTKIRREIKPPGGMILKVPFEKTATNDIVAKLSEEHFTKPNAYYLGIKTNADPTALTRYVMDGSKFKLMPFSMKRLAVFGIELKEERIPPLELPGQAGLYYFILLVKDNQLQWERIREEKACCIVNRNPEVDLSNAEYTLYMTVPS